jgi:HSP20 family protein
VVSVALTIGRPTLWCSSWEDESRSGFRTHWAHATTAAGCQTSALGAHYRRFGYGFYVASTGDRRERGQPRRSVMTLMRFDPFRELDRLANQAVGGAWTAHTLPIEALRRGDQFIIAIDVPGITENDVDVTVERNVVEVSARRQPLRQEGDQVIVDERPQGEFHRQLFLGENLDPSKMTAQVDHGVLTLTVPVSEASKPRKIPIGAANGGAQAIPTTSESQQTVNA